MAFSLWMEIFFSMDSPTILLSLYCFFQLTLVIGSPSGFRRMFYGFCNIALIPLVRSAVPTLPVSVLQIYKRYATSTCEWYKIAFVLIIINYLLEIMNCTGSKLLQFKLFITYHFLIPVSFHVIYFTFRRFKYSVYMYICI